MKTPIEIEYRVVYDQRGWNDDAIWTKRYAEFTERAGADEFAAWVRAKDWARYVEIQQRESVVWAPCIESTPPVELPTEDHHIGWLTATGTELAREDVLGEWFFGDGPKITSSGFSGIPRDKVTRWAPAVAVPASALGELRAAMASFLAAVDSANGDAS